MGDTRHVTEDLVVDYVPRRGRPRSLFEGEVTVCPSEGMNDLLDHEWVEVAKSLAQVVQQEAKDSGPLDDPQTVSLRFKGSRGSVTVYIFPTESGVSVADITEYRGAKHGYVRGTPRVSAPTTSAGGEPK